MGLPYCLKVTKMKMTYAIFLKKKDVLLQIWQQKKEVSRENTVKPNALIDYNKYMKGVDLTDQYLSYCSILLKNAKWAKKTGNVCNKLCMIKLICWVQL